MWLRKRAKSVIVDEIEVRILVLLLSRFFASGFVQEWWNLRFDWDVAVTFGQHGAMAAYISRKPSGLAEPAQGAGEASEIGPR